MNALDTVQGLVVVVVVVDSWDSYFDRSTGRLSLSLLLTQAKPLSSHDSNSRRWL